MSTLSNKKIINTLVLSGGGAKGIAYAGVLKKIDEIKTVNNQYNLIFDINEILGVSVGAIIGFLYSIGFTGEELINEIYKMKTKQLQKFKIVNLLSEWGLDTGESVISWIEELCVKKNINKWITFAELYEITKINLRIGLVNLNRYRFEIFDKNTNPDASVLRILRLAFNLPLIYTKQEFCGDLYLDGGVINNYPIYLYKENLDNILGLKLTSTNERDDEISHNIDSFETYIFNTIYCYMIDKERKLTLNKRIIASTIFINTDMQNPMDAKLKRSDKNNLIKTGYINADNYFKRWKVKLKLD